MDTDRNLLFGVLALQADLIDPASSSRPARSGPAARSVPLADLLVERGWILAERPRPRGTCSSGSSNKHGGDARARLGGVPDDVNARLAALGDAGPPAARWPAMPQPPGMGTAADGRRVATSRGARPLHADPAARHRRHRPGLAGPRRRPRPRRGPEGAAARTRRATRPSAARFLREAQITGQLEHPGIVPVYELARRPDDQQPFYTMRFVRGRTLSEAVRAYHREAAGGPDEPLELPRPADAFVTVCNTVAYAHCAA